MTSNRYPRTARVRARSDFDRIFKHGRRVALPVLALHFQASDDAPRLGLAVSRKVDPNAVGRNRIKRVLRDTFRLHRSRLVNGDYVIVARVGASQCSGDELRAVFLGLLKRAGALSTGAASPSGLAATPLSATGAPVTELPVTSAPGTMPAALPSTDPASTPDVD